MFGEEILMQIDTTLDQLIQNAEMIQNTNLEELSETELEGFQKTQESLIQHLIHMDQHLECKRKDLKNGDRRSASYKIQEKMIRFEKLKSEYHKNISQTVVKGRTPFLSKRRTKRFLAV
jgi:hypothetical protein